MTDIELYVGLKCQYKNRKITYQSNFTVGTQVSRGDCYIHGRGQTLQRAPRSSAGLARPFESTFPGLTLCAQLEQQGAAFPDKLDFPLLLDGSNRICLSALHGGGKKPSSNQGSQRTIGSTSMSWRSSDRQPNSTREVCLGVATTDANKGSTGLGFRDQRVVWIKVYVNAWEANGDAHMFWFKAAATPQLQIKARRQRILKV